MGKLVSVIVPVYQVEKTLERCLQCLVAQTHRELDIILVDDGSLDRSGSICDAWAQRDRRIRVCHKANGGLSSARNAGLDLAQGNWITFVDSDDWIDAQVYERSLAQEADIVEYAMEYDGQHVADPQPAGTYDVQGRQADIWLSHLLYLRTSVCNKVFRRSLFDGLRFPEGETYEDIAVLPDLLLRASQLSTVDDVAYHYTLNDKGICRTSSQSDLRLYLSNMLRAADKLAINLFSSDADGFYLKLLDIQISFLRAGGTEVLLPPRKKLSVAAAQRTTQRLKALLVNTIGLRNTLKLLA